MASVRLSYGEDLQMDWDGRGRLLVKVGPLITASPQSSLTKCPLCCGQSGFVCGRRIHFSAGPMPQMEEQASLVYQRLVFAIWTLLVCPRGSHAWGSGTPRAFRGGGLPRGWGGQICCLASWLQQNLGTGMSLGQQGKSQIGTHSQACVMHP